MSSILVLGRQPKLGLAELESLYGKDKVKPLGSKVVEVDIAPEQLAYERLGGSLKFAKLLSVLDTTDWNKVCRQLIKSAPEHALAMPDAKIYLGVSVIDFNVEIRQLQGLGLSLKKAIIKSTGRSVRYIPNKSLELNSAQIIHNKLASKNGWELLIVKNGNQTYVAQTVKVQDIEAYARRDQARPKRDARVGMLPPKLAQMIINLGAGELPTSSNNDDIIVLDPFCGSGVILQEALIMGYKTYGSDIDERMVNYTKENMDWLQDEEDIEAVNLKNKVIVEEGDALDHEWQQPISFVASEVYLGRAFNSKPDPEVLEQTVSACNLIIKKFLQNIRGQLQPGTRLCLAMPAWNLNNKVRSLPMIDQLTDLGYNLVNFGHVRQEDLIYYRNDQIVARQLVVITRT